MHDSDTVREGERDTLLQAVADVVVEGEWLIVGMGEVEAVAKGERLTVRAREDVGLKDGDSVPLALREGMRLPLGQPEASGERERDKVAEEHIDGVGAGVRVAPRGGEGVRAAVAEALVAEALVHGETLRRALGEFVREGVREAVGERVAEELQVGGAMVPGEEQALGQEAQDRGAAVAGVGQ